MSSATPHPDPETVSDAVVGEEEAGHDDHGHDDHGHDGHGHDGHGHVSSFFVVPPLVVGAIVAVVIVALLGLGSSAPAASTWGAEGNVRPMVVGPPPAGKLLPETLP